MANGETCPFCGRQLERKGELHNCPGGKTGDDRLDERIDQVDAPEPQVSLRDDEDDGLPPAA